MGILFLIINIILAVFCGKLGEEKGYGFGLCLVAGIFGGWLALIIILLLPNRAEEQAQYASQSRRRDEEVTALKQRIAALEAEQPKAAEPSVQEEPAAPPPAGAPAVFPARTDEPITCPRCGKRQRGDRDSCYACQTPFQYENE